MGGIFLQTRNPASKGSVIELIIDIDADGVRARAIVRHVRAGKGMGLQFIQMRTEDRARLNHFLTRLKANFDRESPTAASGGTRTPPREPARKAAPPAANAARQPEHSASHPSKEEIEFEREVKELLQVAVKGTYYQLLAVMPDAPRKQVKEKFYALARKFHPDHHMGSKRIQDLQQLMEFITAAYKTLGNEQAKAAYDKKLATSGAFNLERNKTESQQTVEECLQRANECLKAGNFAGSIVWLRKCVLMAPDVGKYHAILARSLAHIPGYRQEAIEHFEAAIELDPWNIAAHYYFGELYEKMQLPWRASPLYSKILQIDPGHAKARERLASLESAKKHETRRR